MGDGNCGFSGSGGRWPCSFSRLCSFRRSDIRQSCDAVDAWRRESANWSRSWRHVPGGNFFVARPAQCCWLAIFARRSVGLLQTERLCSDHCRDSSDPVHRFCSFLLHILHWPEIVHLRAEFLGDPRNPHSFLHVGAIDGNLSAKKTEGKERNHAGNQANIGAQQRKTEAEEQMDLRGRNMEGKAAGMR